MIEDGSQMDIFVALWPFGPEKILNQI
jgi:hypothetical protein